MASPVTVTELKRVPGVFSSSHIVQWEYDHDVPFNFFANCLVALSEVESQEDCLCNILRLVMGSSPRHLFAIICLLARKFFDEDRSYVIKVSKKDIVLAIAESSKKHEKDIKLDLQQIGDLALVAERNRPSELLFERDPLNVEHLFIKLKNLAKDDGPPRTRTNRFKMTLIGLFKAASTFEAGIIVRLLQPPWDPIPAIILLQALARAAVHSDKNIKPEDIGTHLERAVKISMQIYELRPRLDMFVDALRCSGDYMDFPELVGFCPGIPTKQKEPVAFNDLLEVVKKFDQVHYACEFDIPGSERAQIHCKESHIDIFVNNNCVTNMYSAVVEVISRLKDPSVESFIFECKIVARENTKSNVSMHITDLLYLNGESLLMEQLESRIQLFLNSFELETGLFELAKLEKSANLEDIPSFIKDANSSLILKRWNTDATYQPSKQSRDWLTLEQDLLDSIQYVLHLVPIAAIREKDGEGGDERTDVYSSFLLASYDDVKDEFQAICYIGSTLSKAKIEELSSSLRLKVINEPKASYKYSSGASHDVWFEPTEVWEVKAGLLTTSIAFHACFGVIEPDKGISLCFICLIGAKDGPTKASTSTMVADLYRSQKHIITEEQAG